MTCYVPEAVLWSRDPKDEQAVHTVLPSCGSQLIKGNRFMNNSLWYRVAMS